VVNLYSLEQLALDRQTEMRRQSIRLFLLQQTDNAPDGLAGSTATGSPVRSRVGLLLVRIGLRLADAALPQQRAGTRQCVCVPVNN
jgi:hypothetical protein